jgi:NAD(P)-dependent dehydrogenase (short-subunit alcohol dehydrogenase family)
MKIVVIDGQGGGMGRAIVENLRARRIDGEIVAVGTNSAATSTMLAANADYGVTGENALIVNCRDADYIMGPMGILVADALHGEISPAMAVAVGQSKAKKILLPISRCNTYVVGVEHLALGEYISLAVDVISGR